MAITFLLLSIAFSTFINLIFRWFKEYNVNKFQAIIVNYLVCFVLGISLSAQQDVFSYLQEPWFISCIFLGFIFIGIFFSMALTTEKLGISVTAVSGKMSVVIPVIVAFFFFNEHIGWFFVLGLILSLVSIYLISVKKDLVIERKYIILPVIVFVGGGIIDTSLSLMIKTYGDLVNKDTITYSIFLGAFLAGTSIFLVKNKGESLKIERKSLLAGVLLGVPNYFSIFFLISAFASFSLKNAMVLGVNNIGIVLLSTLLSVLIFKEKLGKGNLIGLILALIAIIIIAYAS